MEQIETEEKTNQCETEAVVETTDGQTNELHAIRTFVPEGMWKAWQHNAPEEQIAGLVDFLKTQGKYWVWNGKTGEIKEKGKGGSEKGTQIRIPAAVIRAELEMQIGSLVQQFPDQEQFITKEWLKVDSLIDQSTAREGMYLLPNAPVTLRNHFQKKIVRALESQERESKGKTKNRNRPSKGRRNEDDEFEGYTFRG